MRQALRQWIADADTRNNIVAFQLASTPRKLAYQQGREVDLYYSLVSELFDLMRVPPEDARDWVTLGDALAAAAAAFVESVTSSDAFLFAAAAYFWGGNSASAYLTMRRATPSHWASDTYRACYDLLGRPNKLTSAHVQELVDAVRQGDTGAVENAAAQAQSATAKALRSDPDEWIASRLYESLVARFAYVNIRAGLPGSSDPRWDALVASMLDRTPPVWDFFPSQMQAIQAGLLTSSETFSLQMPTGSGKTALMETLIYQHTTARPTDIAVLLVPYRALAGELRRTLVKRLSGMGVTSRAVFGGTVPTAEESEHLGQVQALVSTPESLVGLIGRHPELLARTSLVICDEGHLIDSGDRGVGLELLLTRLRHGTPSPPRVVFASAIVPNIEEINAWLGGTKSTVVRSNFQPAAIDYAVLRPRGEGVNVRVDLELRPTVTALPQHTLPAFLPAARFVYRNPDTGRNRTYPHESIKSQSIAAARRALLLGPVAVFSTTKTGNQGVVALAEELLKQVDSGIDLPRPSDSIPDPAALDRAAEYLGDEYGHDWIGSQTLRAGAVLHHGDIPQETRTVLEELVNSKKVPMVLCTSTLAEGVNLPIRTLVLNSVARRSATGERTPLQPREIRNLVGRAGRPGGATRALVICANPNDWNHIQPATESHSSERVMGELFTLVRDLKSALERQRSPQLTDELLDNTVELYPLIDGIDSTLIELLHDDVADETFIGDAPSLADKTLAAKNLSPQETSLLRRVFALRAGHLVDLKTSGKLRWVKASGARARLTTSVERDFGPTLDALLTVESVLDEGLIAAAVGWAYSQSDFVRTLRDTFQLKPEDPEPSSSELVSLVSDWISGRTFKDIADRAEIKLDSFLRVHSALISHSLATLVEQGVALYVESRVDSAPSVPEPILFLADHIRFGVREPHARVLMARGVRHRRAAVKLGDQMDMSRPGDLLVDPLAVARRLLASDERYWRQRLGKLVYDQTKLDCARPKTA